MMEFVISEQTIKATTECKEEFACLTIGVKDLCRVKGCKDHDVYFIKCLEHKDCPYQERVDHTCFCGCPTRREIFDKYNV